VEALIILAVWIAVVGAIDVVVIRPWRSQAARAPLPLILGTAAAAWVIGTGFFGYRQLMAEGAWTGASIAMGFVPAKAIVVSLIAYAAGRSFLSALTTSAPLMTRWALPALLAAVLVYSIASDISRLHSSALERHARNPALTDAETSALAQKIRAGDAGREETFAFLGNPRCPDDLLGEYAASPDAYWRSAVARNDAIGPDIAAKLAADPDEQVRFYLAFNRKLPAEILIQLAADPSDNVRNTVVWTDALPDESFDRLVNDSSAKVRATAALQPRLSKMQREKLRNDPEERVREAASRYGGE
jgi:hypothetical protein